MRTLNTLLLATFAIFAFATGANAQTTVRITGSTAYRGATHAAITHILDAGFTYGYTGSTLSGAGQAIFTGNLSGTPVIIKTSWSGSAGGVQTVSQGLSVNFLPDGTTQSTGGTPGASTGSEAGIPDVAMSDTYQNATPFTSPALTDIVVGVVPFKWVVSRGLTQSTIAVDTTASSNIATVADTSTLSAGMTISGNSNIPNDAKIGAITSATTFTIVKNSDGSTRNATATATGVNTIFSPPAPISTITPQLAQALWGNGSIELSLFTGSSGDIGKKVFAIGRDPDSGTRITAFAEGGIGVSATVTQYQPTTTGSSSLGNLAVSSHIPWPAGPVNGIPVVQGNGGYASGGTLAGVMGATTSALNGYYITYLSTGDAATAISAGAKELTYNGVPYSLSAVQQGLYTFWGYEHVMYKSSLSGTAKTVADTLANKILLVDATVLLNSMKVVRSSDGGLVTQNF